MTVIKENVVEQYLCDRVKALGGEVRKVAWIGRRGAPDRLVMLPQVLGFGSGARKGTHCFVEVKRPGEHPTAAQFREHDRMRAAGMQVCYVNDTAGIDALLERTRGG